MGSALRLPHLQPGGGPLEHWQHHDQLNTFWVTYMFTWCFFFTLTLLIHILNVLRFHSLLPISWKNMTVTVAALGALMTFSASVLFSWTVMSRPLYKPLAAAVASCLTVLAYCSEVWVIRRQTREQRGYMASLPGFLKILQCWGGCQMIPLFVGRLAEPDWQLWLSVGLCNVCLLMSLASITVILCDCTGRCPFPFDRLLAAFSLLGVVHYMIATVISVTNVLLFNKLVVLGYLRFELAIMETVIVSITLLAYTVDFSISIKLLCERVHG